MGDTARRAARKRREHVQSEDELLESQEPKHAKQSKKSSTRAALEETKASKLSSGVFEREIKSSLSELPLRKSPRRPQQPTKILVPPTPSPPRVSHKSKRIPNEQKQLEVEELLKETERNSEYEKIIADKDAAYASLLDKYNKLKISFEKGQAQVFADFSANTEQNEKVATEAVRRFKESAAQAHSQLKLKIAECEELKKQQVKIKADAAKKSERQVVELREANVKLQAELKQERDAAKKSERQVAELREANANLQAELKQERDRVARGEQLEKRENDFKHAEKKADELAATNASLQQELTNSREKLERLTKKYNDARKAEKQVEELTEANVKLQAALKQEKESEKAMKQVAELREITAKLETELKEEKEKLLCLEKVEETYRLLTATEVTHLGGTKFSCHLVKHYPYRVIKFELDSEVENIIYNPAKVSLKKSFLGCLKTRISFAPDQTPLLMRLLLNTVYDDEFKVPVEFNTACTPSKARPSSDAEKSAKTTRTPAKNTSS